MSIIVRIVGMEKAKEISEQLGGEAIYIPRRVREGRDDTIKREFRELICDGATCMSSYRQLARKYELSPRRVMTIVR
jgi:Mor family transcriptional regulator